MCSSGIFIEYVLEVACLSESFNNGRKLPHSSIKAAVGFPKL